MHKAGGSLKDVQELAGYSALTTTERYIEGDRDAQRRLVRMLQQRVELLKSAAASRRGRAGQGRAVIPLSSAGKQQKPHRTRNGESVKVDGSRVCGKEVGSLGNGKAHGQAAKPNLPLCSTANRQIALWLLLYW